MSTPPATSGSVTPGPRAPLPWSVVSCVEFPAPGPPPSPSFYRRCFIESPPRSPPPGPPIPRPPPGPAPVIRIKPRNIKGEEAAQQWFEDHNRRVSMAMLQHQEDHFYDHFDKLCPDFTIYPYKIFLCRIHQCPFAFGESLRNSKSLKRHLRDAAHKKFDDDAPPRRNGQRFPIFRVLDLEFVKPDWWPDGEVFSLPDVPMEIIFDDDSLRGTIPNDDVMVRLPGEVIFDDNNRPCGTINADGVFERLPDDDDLPRGTIPNDDELSVRLGEINLDDTLPRGTIGPIPGDGENESDMPNL